MMLSDYTAQTTLGVSDLSRARNFYEGVLGFTPATDMGEGVVYASGTGSSFLVYLSAFAGTNQATALSFQVPGSTFDDEIAALRDEGVAFQTYELDGVTWDDGVASMGDGMRSAWFEDPDGNILNVETSPAIR